MLLSAGLQGILCSVIACPRWQPSAPINSRPHALSVYQHWRNVAEGTRGSAAHQDGVRHHKVEDAVDMRAALLQHLVQLLCLGEMRTPVQCVHQAGRFTTQAR